MFALLGLSSSTFDGNPEYCDMSVADSEFWSFPWIPFAEGGDAVGVEAPSRAACSAGSRTFHKKKFGKCAREQLVLRNFITIQTTNFASLFVVHAYSETKISDAET